MKVLEGPNWAGNSCVLVFLPVVTKSNFELLLDGNVNVGMDAGHDIWRWVDNGLWFASLTRIWVGCSIGALVVESDEAVVNNWFAEEEVKLCSKVEVEDILSLLVLVDPGNEAATPEDETKLGDVASDDDEAMDGIGLNNDDDISLVDVGMSNVLDEEGMIFILFIPPLSSIVIWKRIINFLLKFVSYSNFILGIQE